MILLLSSLLFSSPALAGKYTTTLDVDCGAWCGARNLTTPHCNGISFKDKKGDYHDSEWSGLLQGCYMRSESLYLNFISKKKMDEAVAKCTCTDLPPLPTDLNATMTDETTQKLVALQSQIKTWAPCAPDPDLALPDSQRPFGPSDIDSCEHMKAQGKHGYIYLGGCNQEGDSNCVYYGNTNNYSGPFCYSGDSDRCDEVRRSQDPATGAWYRNAYFAKYPLQSWGQPLFSRDEFLGVMLYLVKTKDKVAAEKWMKFIANNPKKKSSILKFVNVFNFCPPLPATKPDFIPDESWNDMQPDDRCEMRPDAWATMYWTYKNIGFSDLDLMRINFGIYLEMKAISPLSGLAIEASVEVLPPVTYEQGDQMSSVLLLHAMGRDAAQAQNGARILDKRTSYESAWYHFLAEGNQATEYGANLIQKYCPTVQPTYVWTPHGLGVPAAGYFDSAVHYFNGLDSGWINDYPTGHECIGWINFYLNARAQASK